MSTELLPYGTLVDLDAIVDRVSRPRDTTTGRSGPQPPTDLAPPADTAVT